MAGTERIQQRFDELTRMAGTIAANTHTGTTEFDTPIESVNSSELIQWKTSVTTLLSRVFGRDHPTCEAFETSDGFFSYSKSTFDVLAAIFASAKSDFEGGYLFDVRKLVHAEVFSDELQQAEHFLTQGYKLPAAVIAGTVLETTLRSLCDQHPTLAACDKLNTMNDDLARVSVYNKMRADQVRAWAKIRNSAAHGHPEEFEDGDVTRMIDGIRDFVAKHMS